MIGFFLKMKGMFQNKQNPKSLEDFSLEDLGIDTSKPIPEVEDKHLNWTGKDQGKPKPPLIWFGDRST